MLFVGELCRPRGSQGDWKIVSEIKVIGEAEHQAPYQISKNVWKTYANLTYWVKVGYVKFKVEMQILPIGRPEGRGCEGCIHTPPDGPQKVCIWRFIKMMKKPE